MGAYSLGHFNMWQLQAFTMVFLAVGNSMPLDYKAVRNELDEKRQIFLSTHSYGNATNTPGDNEIIDPTKQQFPETPMMTENEYTAVQEVIKPDDIFLEWGSGGSTVFFAPLITSGKYFSVEHDADWAPAVAQKIADLGLTQVTYEVIKRAPSKQFEGKNCPEGMVKEPTGNDPFLHEPFLKTAEDCDSECNPYNEYDHMASELAERDTPPLQYDIVLVDGRSRVCAAYNALNYLKPGGTLFVHDYMQKIQGHTRKTHPMYQYEKITQWYTEVNTVDTLGVFKKK